MRNHLHHNVTLLARLKPQDILRMRDDMKGTKKKMAVYRCAGHGRADTEAHIARHDCVAEHEGGAAPPYFLLPSGDLDSHPLEVHGGAVQHYVRYLARPRILRNASAPERL